MSQINEIAWNQLHHAYGTCEEFPEVLQALASSVSEKRLWARNWLEELLFHQGTHYPANEFAIPFLFQTAANPLLPERGKLFNFLSRFLAEGSIPKTPRQIQLWNDRFQRKYGMISGVDHWRNLKRQSLTAAWKSRDLLVKMTTTDPEVPGRCWAIFLLAHLGFVGRHFGGSHTEHRPCVWYSLDEVGEILRLFQDRAVTDSNPAVRACAAFGIGFLRDDPQAASVLRVLEMSGNDPATCLAAAAARHIVENSLPREVTARVVEGIVKNSFNAMGSGCVYDGSENVLVAAYGKLGFELDTGRGPSTTSPFAFVPFPKLKTWLAAALDDKLPLVELVERSLESASNAEKCRAVALLGGLKLPSDDVIQYLHSLLTDRDPLIRMSAAVAVGRNGPKYKAPVQTIVSAFRAPLRSRHSHLRLRAVNYLCRLSRPKPCGPIPRAMPMVLRAARMETDLQVRKAICQFLHRAAIEERIDPTYQNLERPLSANAKQAVRILAVWLADSDTTEEALRSLREFYSQYRQTQGPRAPRAALEPLLKLLHSEASYRHRAPAILARIRSDRVMPAFIESLRRETDSEVRAALRWALDRLPDRARASDAILKAHSETGLPIDGHLAQFLALNNQTSREVAETLVQVLRSTQRDRADEEDRCRFIEAIGWLSGAPELTSNALLDTALTDPEFKVRWNSAKAFSCAKVSVELVLEGCRRIVDSRNQAAIGGMLEVLEYGNTPTMPDLAPSLLFLLNHPDHHWRELTVKALAKFRADDAEVEQAVLRALGDESGSVVYAAARYPFHVLPARVVVPRLIELAPNLGFSVWFTLVNLATVEDLLVVVEGWLATFDGWQLESICEWATKQGPKAAALAQTLSKRLEDPQPAIRFSVAGALVAVDPLMGGAVLNALEPLMGHELEVVRKRAAEMREVVTRLKSVP